MRQYDVLLPVRTATPVADDRPTGESTGDPERAAPEQFLWRDRLYVVREVLASWRERTAWWTGAAAREVHGEGGGAVDGRTDLERRWEAADRWVWRVEAGAGRAGVSGTFEISCEGPSEGATWRMVRVCD